MKMTIEEILDSIEEICKREKVEHLYLFGSYAKNTQTSTSDIDIVVKNVPDIDKLKALIEDIPTLKK